MTQVLSNITTDLNATVGFLSKEVRTLVMPLTVLLPEALLRCRKMSLCFKRSMISSWVAANLNQNPVFSHEIRSAHTAKIPKFFVSCLHSDTFLGNPATESVPTRNNISTQVCINGQRQCLCFHGSGLDLELGKSKQAQTISGWYSNSMEKMDSSIARRSENLLGAASYSFARRRSIDAAASSAGDDDMEISSQKRSRSERRAMQVAAQDALLDYLQSTRNFEFRVAENMSRNSPIFVNKLLLRVTDVHKEDVKNSVTRFLRYHPVNEYELFFESIGMDPSCSASLLPRDSPFLSSDPLLLENCNVLCRYGVLFCHLGRMYVEAREIFRYDHGVMKTKLVAYEGLGLNQRTVIKLVICSPLLLVGNVDENLIKLLKEFNEMGIAYDRIHDWLSPKKNYHWAGMLWLLKLFEELGFRKNDLERMIKNNHEFLFTGAGWTAYFLVTLFIKSGLRMNQISSLLLQYPEISKGAFPRNFKSTMRVLSEINMETKDMIEIFRCYPHVLGSRFYKTTKRLLRELDVGKEELCALILENPERLDNFARAKRSSPSLGTGLEEQARRSKVMFLLGIGFVENSIELEKALKRFKARGDEIQERFECLLNAGLEYHAVVKIVKAFPRILENTRSTMQEKIDLLVYTWGYPVQALLSCPKFFCYQIDKINFRLSFYDWLKKIGAIDEYSLSSLLGSGDKTFFNYIKESNRRACQKTDQRNSVIARRFQGRSRY